MRDTDIKSAVVRNRPDVGVFAIGGPLDAKIAEKIEGRLRYYPCPVIYDDPRFELGETLEESFRRVYVAHKNCYDYCLKGRGASCRTRPL